MRASDTPVIDRGLASFEPDHYAVLGVPLMATSSQIRKGYLRVAKVLHPDRFIGHSDLAQTAGWLFSKLINPANDALSSESERIEYEAILRLRVKQLMDSPPPALWPVSPQTQALVQANNWEETYSQLVRELAVDQYLDLDQALARTGELSDLNLAYLLLKGGYRAPARASTPSFSDVSLPPTLMPSSPSATASEVANNGRTASNVTGSTPNSRPVYASSSAATTPPTATSSASPEPTPDPAQVRFQQAMDMAKRKQFKSALLYFNEAIKEDDQNPEVFVQRGLVYMAQKNPGLARLDFQQAVKLDPKHAEALRYLKYLDRDRQNGDSAKANPTPDNTQATRKQPANNQGNQKKDPPTGGFLNRLFKR